MLKIFQSVIHKIYRTSEEGMVFTGYYATQTDNKYAWKIADLFIWGTEGLEDYVNFNTLRETKSCFTFLELVSHLYVPKEDRKTWHALNKRTTYK